jgi:polyisoprenoid-binding protein YceI
MGFADPMKKTTIVAIAVFWMSGSTFAQALQHEIEMSFVPAKTTVNFTLGDTLHTVHGSFNLKRGAIRFDPQTNRISGEILVEASGGNSGSSGRDRRMRNEVLESIRYPDIVFRPDRVDGEVGDMGTSTVQVHGMFSIHGAEHEITVPVRVEMSPGQWSANSHFTVPYVKWGMRNPSTFVLRVDQSVEILIQASGETP